MRFTGAEDLKFPENMFFKSCTQKLLSCTNEIHILCLSATMSCGQTSYYPCAQSHPDVVVSFHLRMSSYEKHETDVQQLSAV